MIFSTHTLHEFFTINIDQHNSVQVCITAINEDGTVELSIKADDGLLTAISPSPPVQEQ